MEPLHDLLSKLGGGCSRHYSIEKTSSVTKCHCLGGTNMYKLIGATLLVRINMQSTVESGTVLVSRILSHVLFAYLVRNPSLSFWCATRLFRFSTAITKYTHSGFQDNRVTSLANVDERKGVRFDGKLCYFRHETRPVKRNILVFVCNMNSLGSLLYQFCTAFRREYAMRQQTRELSNTPLSYISLRSLHGKS